MQKAEIPILGICFGHQLLCTLNGGAVANNPSGTEIGTVKTQLTDAGKQDRLLQALPPVFHVHKSHKQSISMAPGSAKVLAMSDSGIIDAFRIGDTIWGLQFHPEFTTDILQSYIEAKSKELKEEELDEKGKKRNVINVDFADQILSRFNQIVNDL